MKKLIIVGAGGLARMVYSWLDDLSDQGFEPCGFVSDNVHLLENLNYQLPIISTIQDYIPEEDHILIMAIADPKSKLCIARTLEARGGKFINFIHPTAIIGKNVEIGTGCIISPRTVLTCDIQIGDYCLLNIGVTIGHDAVIGNGTTINSHSDVTGGVKLGEGVFLGSHAVITPNVKVGDYARIGAGSVVVKQVKAESAIFGVPAKKI